MNINKNIFQQKYKLFGFTLAEVLITLGIIGIVAAMTIPVLLNNTENTKYKTAAKETYSKTSQVIAQMKLEYGDNLIGYYQGNWPAFFSDFASYYKVAKNCGTSGCVLGSAASTVYTSLDGTPAHTNELGADGQFVTIDGVFYNIQQEAASPYRITITVDVNGYQAKPNVYGVDTFTFQILGNKLVPMGASGTEFPVGTYCQRTGSSSYQGAGCMQNVMLDADY